MKPLAGMISTGIFVVFAIVPFSCRSREYNADTDVKGVFDFGRNSARSLKNWRLMEPAELIKHIDCDHVRAKGHEDSSQSMDSLTKTQSELLAKWKTQSLDSDKITGDSTILIAPVTTRVETLAPAERAAFIQTDLELAEVRWTIRYTESKAERAATCTRISSEELPIAEGRKKIALGLDSHEDEATKIATLLPDAFSFADKKEATLQFWKFTENALRVDDLKHDLVYTVNPEFINQETDEKGEQIDKKPDLSPYALMLLGVKSAQGSMTETLEFSEKLSPENFPSVKIDKKESCDNWVNKWQVERGGISHYWSHRDLYLKFCHGNPAGMLISTNKAQQLNYCEMPLEFRMCFVCNDLFVNKGLDKPGRFRANFATCKPRLTSGEQNLFVNTFDDILKK